MIGNRGLWVRRGLWAIGDQGLFAVSSFAANVLLARWMAPRDYGAFALVFALFLLVGIVHSSVTSDPLLVFGSDRYRDTSGPYLALVTIGAAGLAVSCGGLLLIASTCMRPFAPEPLPRTFLGFALAAPGILFAWFLRRACYLRRIPALSATAGGVYFVTLLGALAGLHSGGWLTPFTAAAAMGASSLVVAGLLLVRLGVGRPGRGMWEKAREVAGVHWEYGRWSGLALLLSWAGGTLFTVLLAARAGLEATAALAAMVSLTMPAVHAITAVTLLIQPVLSAARGTPEFARTARVGLALFGGAALLQWLSFGIAHTTIVGAVYAGRYDAHASSLWILGCIPVFYAATSILGAVLRALERTRSIFMAQLSGTPIALAVGIALMLPFGYTGAAIGYTLSYAVTALGITVRGLRAVAQRPPAGALGVEGVCR